MLSALQARLDETTLAGCFQGIQFQTGGYQASCYGPNLYFVNHPDASGNFEPPPNDQCQVSGSGNGCLPTGDLGLWDAEESGTGEACTAAKMNSLVLSTSQIVGFDVTLMVGMICSAKVRGDDLAVGTAPLSLAEVVNENLPGASLEEAKLERLADQSDGRPTYRIEISGSLGETPLFGSLTHSPGTDGAASGQLHGYVDRADMGGQVRQGFSVAYEITDGKIRYQVRSAVTPTTATEEQLFDEDGTYLFDVFASGDGGPSNSNGNYGAAELDVATGLGTMYNAWQAGGHDSFTRVFQAHTEAQDGEADQGFGYFGFGPPITSPDVGEIAGMICNWAGPGADFHGWQDGEPIVDTTSVQGQTMARDATSGLFEPVLNHIQYAPVKACEYTAPETGFVYSTTADTNSELGLLTAEPVANELVAYGDPTIGTMPEITPPAPYTP
jgi:hypothetical protein